MESTQPVRGSAPVQNHPQPPAHAPAATTASTVATSNAKKRPLEDITPLQNSPYYKMRAIVRDLRPHLLEVLRTPDFRNCKGAEEIREKMKIFMTVYKEMMGQTTDTDASQKVSGLHLDVKDHQQDMKPPTQPVLSRHAENKRLVPGGVSQNQQAELGRLEGTYIVGGSAFGWNYVTFPGTKSAVYYGRTKEAFRAANIKSQWKDL